MTTCLPISNVRWNPCLEDESLGNLSSRSVHSLSLVFHGLVELIRGRENMIVPSISKNPLPQTAFLFADGVVVQRQF
ncbi:hypothetical protein NPIL_218081 [Nephila pilipes]|uniref:Uncharacterized protein n=1 Tax=Nephila pilipes TaxID=299642 RepID=A0A8X6P587_NEPPI|nr:hypothetical protein NPIL_218081 [Nephila pilipes]